MTPILALIALNVAAFLLTVGAVIRALTQPHDRCSPQQPYQQPRRLRVGQSRNHFGDDV